MIQPLFAHMKRDQQIMVCAEGITFEGKTEEINYNGLVINGYYIPFNRIDYVKSKSFQAKMDRMPFNFWKSMSVFVDDKIEIITSCENIVGTLIASDTDMEGRTKYFLVEGVDKDQYIIDISKVIAMRRLT